MTREEKIICKHFLDDADKTHSCNEYKLLMALLEQEPVLDKIREQMKNHLRGVEITLEVLVENDPLRPKMEGAKDTLEECLKIIDKAESET